MFSRLWLTALSLSFFGVAAIASPSDRLSEWQQFRSVHPYHIQTVALSRPDNAGKRLLIVSEPPPSVTMEQLTAVAPRLLLGGIVERTRVGFDGSVADALFELPAMGDSTLRSLIESLHIKLYGTAYKAVAAEIPEGPPAKTGFDFDLHINAGTLARWLVPLRPALPPFSWWWIVVFCLLALYGRRFIRSERSVRRGLALLVAICGLGYQFGPRAMRVIAPPPDVSLRFRPITGGDPHTVAQLFEAKTPGVFASEQPGLMLWVVPRSGALDSQKREARWFALDSDILLGAVADSNYVAILGRERVVPVDLLPPLRTETILLLASVKENELAQSYERNHFFAGPTTNGPDWAPIYLSDTLIDTEYGSLLNVTDQILKSWSMHGQIEYVNFGYPKPQTFPFPTPLVEFVKTGEVTFNWNTKGAGYSMQAGGYDFFAWNRTGALPVDYLGESNGELRSAEETGYNYFAQLSDPNLVRVVQYAEMYQIFRHYGIQAAAQEPPFHLKAPPLFEAVLVRMLQSVGSLEDNEIDILRLPGDLKTELQQVRDGIAEVKAKAGEEALEDLASAIAAPRLFSQTHGSSGAAESVLRLAAECERSKGLLGALTGMTRDQARLVYVQYATRQNIGWIHTPSIVESKATGSLAGGVGGHNLDSAITGFRVSKDVAPGEIRIVEENGSRVVLHSEADTDKVGETVRTAAREQGSEEEVEGKLRAALAAAHEDTRPLGDALGFTTAHRPDPSRGLAEAHLSPAIERTGWWTRDGILAEKQAVLLGALNSDGSHAIIIERTSQGGYVLFDGPSRRIVEASNEPAAIDALLAYAGGGKRAGPIRLHMRGFEPRSASNFTQSAEVQLAGFGDVPEIRATLDTAEIEAKELKTLLAERFNFHEVTIKEVSAPFLTPEGEMAVHVDAEVAIAKSSEPLHVRFLIALRKGVQMTAELVQRIQTTILSAFRAGEVVQANDGTLLLTGKIIDDLKLISPDISYVHAKVSSHEVKDFYIVLNAVRDRLVAG